MIYLLLKSGIQPLLRVTVGAAGPGIVQKEAGKK